MTFQLIRLIYPSYLKLRRCSLAVYLQLQLLWVYIESRSVNLRTVYTAATRHAALQRISPECFVNKQLDFLILREGLRNFGSLQQL